MPAPPSGHRHRLLPILLSQGAGFICGVAGVRLTSTLVPPDVLGRYGIFLSVAVVGMSFIHAGVIKFVTRHWAASMDRAGLLRGALKTAGRKMIWVALITGAATPFIVNQDRALTFAMLFSAACLLTGVGLAQAALQAAREHWRDLAVSATASLTRSFAPPLLYAFTGGTTLALFAAFDLHALVAVAMGAWALQRYWRSLPNPSSPPALAPVYEGPLFIALAAVSWLMLSLNRWVVALFFGVAAAGQFTLASNLAAVGPMMLASVVLQYVQPIFFALPAGDRATLARRVDHAALVHAAASIAALVALKLLAPLLMGRLIGEHYRPALQALLPAGAFALTLGTGYFYHSMLLAGRRERACGPVDCWTAAAIVTGCVASAALGEAWFYRWLLVTPFVPWLLTRTLARRYLNAPDAPPASAPAL